MLLRALIIGLLMALFMIKDMNFSVLTSMEAAKIAAP
jgi:hypothetical protein